MEIYELLKAPVSPEVRYLGDQCGNRYFPNSKSARVKTRQSLVVISYLLSVGGPGSGELATASPSERRTGSRSREIEDGRSGNDEAPASRYATAWPANEEIMLMLMLMLMLESENHGQRPRPEIRSHKSEIRSVTIARLRVSGF